MEIHVSSVKSSLREPLFPEVLKRSTTQCTNFSRIAWYKDGLIAYIEDGTVKLTQLVFKNGERIELALGSALSGSLYKIHQGAPIVHLSWSNVSPELACIDCEGKVSIHQVLPDGTAVALFQPALDQSRHESELNGIMAFKWFDSDKTVLVPTPAVKDPNQQQFAYGVLQARQLGPFHPIQRKQACIAVTRRGTIRVIAQLGVADNRYYEVRGLLEKSALARQTTDDLITHASIKSCLDHFLVAVYVGDKSIFKVFRVYVKWDVAQNPPKPTSEFAALHAVKLMSTTIDAGRPDLALTHLVAMPNVPQKQPPSEVRNEIVAVFSNTTESLVKTYALANKTIPLHEAFMSLNTRRDQGSKTDEIIAKLEAADEREYSSPVISVGFEMFDLYTTLCCADGTIEATHRSASASVQGERQLVSLLSDAGFSFPQLPDGDALTDVAVAPNMCGYVYLSPAEKTLKFVHMVSDLDYSSLQSMPQEEVARKLTLPAVAFAVRHSACCFSGSVCADDIFAVLATEMHRSKAAGERASRKFLRATLEESYRAVNFSLDLQRDQQLDKLMLNPSLQRLLSMQLVLGTSKGFQRDPMARVAWLALNVRLLAFALTLTLRNAAQPKIPPGSPLNEVDLKANLVLSVLGLTRWCVDLMIAICQELYVASVEEGDSYYFGGTERKSVCMAVVLGRIPRSFLTYSFRAIRGLDQIIAKTVEKDPTSEPARIAARQLRDIIQSSPVSMAVFEKLLTDVENVAKAVLTPMSPRERLGVEQGLIFNAAIAAELTPSVRRILEIFRKAILPELDVPKLYFYETSWVGADEEATSGTTGGGDGHLAGSSHNIIDVLRKQIVSEYSGNKRACVRCGGVYVADDSNAKSPYPVWTLTMQRYCLCGANWRPVR